MFMGLAGSPPERYYILSYKGNVQSPDISSLPQYLIQSREDQHEMYLLQGNQKLNTRLLPVIYKHQSTSSL